MINKGIVKEVKTNTIKVHLYKESACAHCAGCGEKSKMGSTFEFKCNEKVEIGNLITFEIEDKSLLNIAALVYLLPIFFMILGYYAGEFLKLPEGGRVLFSFLGLFVSFGLIHIFDRIKGHKMIDQKIKVIKVEDDTVIQNTDCSL